MSLSVQYFSEKSIPNTQVPSSSGWNGAQFSAPSGAIDQAATTAAENFTRRSPPLVATRSIGAITGGTPDLSSVEFYEINDWTGISGIRPSLSQTSIREFQVMSAPIGAAFSDQGREIAIVTDTGIERSSRAYGVSAQESRNYWATQEIAHGYFQDNADQNLSVKENNLRSEMFGEAAAAVVSPRMATIIAIGHLATDRADAVPGYDRYLDIAEASLNDTLMEFGFQSANGKSPAEQFCDILLGSMRVGGDAPFHQIYDRHVENFIREKATAGFSVDAARLRAAIQENYVEALTVAAREIAPFAGS